MTINGTITNFQIGMHVANHESKKNLCTILTRFPCVALADIICEDLKALIETLDELKNLIFAPSFDARLAHLFGTIYSVVELVFVVFLKSIPFALTHTALSLSSAPEAAPAKESFLNWRFPKEMQPAVAVASGTPPVFATVVGNETNKVVDVMQ